MGDAIKFIESKVKLIFLIKKMPGDENIMVILSSPSGVGKTTLTKKIQQNIPVLRFQFHIQQGLQDQTKFSFSIWIIISSQKKSSKQMIEQKKFYEFAKIFENYYGTLKESVDENIIT